jgi:hypothetical protein
MKLPLNGNYDILKIKIKYRKFEIKMSFTVSEFL